MSTNVHAVSNLHVHSEERVFWFAMNAARERGCIACVRDQWVSDATVLSEAFSALKARIIWEESQPALSRYAAVVEVGDVVIQVARDRRDLNCSVFSAGIMSAEDTLKRVRELLPDAERQDNLLDVTFWYGTQHGPRRYDRQLEVPKWKDIASNYPQNTREKLTRLQSVKLQEGMGKLLLWQGEPGTGKTFALRALGEEWASWCRLHYVLDPEKFFDQGDYLLSVILEDDNALPSSSSRTQRPPYRLIVLEDAGELLAKDARVQMGQGLSRLLNLTSGLLGQGLRVLVLITTNEEIGTLHEAVKRPGRCLSQIVFDKFDSKTADDWLRAHDSQAIAPRNPTLADLYALVEGVEIQPARAAGFVGGAQ